MRKLVFYVPSSFFFRPLTMASAATRSNWISTEANIDRRNHPEHQSKARFQGFRLMLPAAGGDKRKIFDSIAF